MDDWNPIQSLIENAAITDDNNEVAATTVLRYWDEMNAVEREFADASENALYDVIAAKSVVHDKFWAKTVDDYWRPCSHSNDEEYRVSDIDGVFVLSDFRAAFVVRLTIRQDSSRLYKSDIAYLLQTEDGTEEGRLVIVNQFS
jgi:hypothetical protein